MSDLYAQEEDLRLLKIVTSDTKAALAFSTSEAPTYLLGDARDIGLAIAEYTKIYRALPSKRVLLERSTSDDLTNKISALYETFESVEAHSTEYFYELSKIKKRYIDSQISSLTEDLRFNSGDAEKIISKMRTALREIDATKNERKAFTAKNINDYTNDFRKLYLAKKNEPEKFRGTMTGYSYLDYVTNGIREGDMWVIASESAGGKSLLLSNIAVQMWMQSNTINTPTADFKPGYNVLYFSLEMPFEMCLDRMLAKLADVPHYGVRDAKLMPAEFLSMKKSLKFIDRYPNKFRIVDVPRGASIFTIEDAYLEAKAEFNPDIVVIDYLGLMSTESTGDDWLKLGKISEEIHEFGRVFGAKVLTAAQLNRPGKDSKKEPADLIGMHRIGRSAMIMHNANVGIQIETRPNEKQRSDFVYHIIKNRSGESGGYHAIEKNLGHQNIKDVPYEVPGRDEYGGLSSGIASDEDISDKLSEYLEL